MQILLTFQTPIDETCKVEDNEKRYRKKRYCELQALWACSINPCKELSLGSIIKNPAAS